MKYSFVRATALTGVAGRINYISNPKKQEKLEAFYDQMPQGYWKKLGEYCQRQGALYNPDKKVCEGRELIVMLPNEFAAYNPGKLAELVGKEFSAKHGVPCAVALHWNKKENNYHAHIVFSERELALEVEASVATRNTYFNAAGKRSTKKECTDERGDLLPGCRLVAKGENLSEGGLFGAKKNFSRHDWLLSEKHRLTDFFNRYATQHGWKVYDRNVDYHLATMHVGKDSPAGLIAWKERENERIVRYNQSIDALIAAGELTENQAIGLKFKVLRERKAAREQRMAEREQYRRAREERLRDLQARRATEREYYWRLRRKSVLGLAVELAVVLTGRVRYDDLQSRTSTPAIDGSVVQISRDVELQRQIDDMYIAMGKIPPSQRVLKVKAENNREDTVKPRKSALDDVIARAAERSRETDRSNGSRAPRANPSSDDWDPYS